MGPCVRRDDSELMSWSSRLKREAARISAHVRRRAERLAVDRAIVVFAREVGVPDIRRKRVIGEFAVARQYLDAGIEPGTLGDVDAGVRALLVGRVGSARSVIGTAVSIELLGLRAGLRRVQADDDNGGSRKQN